MQDISFQANPMGFDVIFKPVFREKDEPFSIWPSYPNGHQPSEHLDDTIKYLHYHNDLEFGVCYKGSGQFIVDNRVFDFHAPCAELIYPGQIHAGRSNPDDPAYWYIVHVDSKVCGESHLLCSSTPILSNLTQNHEDIITMMSILIRSIQSATNGNYSDAISLLQVILHKHRELGGDSARTDSGIIVNDIAPAIVFITSHYQEACPVQQLAELCCMSVPTLRRKFLQSVGYAPNDYLHRIRIKNAVSLLSNPNLSILDISAAVGYQSISSFNRQFLKIMKKTPNEARRSLASGQAGK